MVGLVKNDRAEVRGLGTQQSALGTSCDDIRLHDRHQNKKRARRDVRCARRTLLNAWRMLFIESMKNFSRVPTKRRLLSRLFHHFRASMLSAFELKITLPLGLGLG